MGARREPAGLSIAARDKEQLQMNKLDRVEETQLRKNLPRFQPGDTVRVHVRIKESETKERLQAI